MNVVNVMAYYDFTSRAKKAIAGARFLDALVNVFDSFLGTGILTERQEEVFRMRYIEHRTLEYVAVHFDCSKENVNRIETEIFRKVAQTKIVNKLKAIK